MLSFSHCRILPTAVTLPQFGRDIQHELPPKTHPPSLAWQHVTSTEAGRSLNTGKHSHRRTTAAEKLHRGTPATFHFSRTPLRLKPQGKSPLSENTAVWERQLFVNRLIHFTVLRGWSCGTWRTWRTFPFLASNYPRVPAEGMRWDARRYDQQARCRLEVMDGRERADIGGPPRIELHFLTVYYISLCNQSSAILQQDVGQSFLLIAVTCMTD